MKQIPIVLACSGCSRAGQLANRVALELDRRGIAEMSCLAGIGAAKPLFLKKLRGRQVWIIDGCPIDCSLGVLRQVHQQADLHIRLDKLGVQRNADHPEGEEFDELMIAVLDQARSGG
ncbi:putative zinc-binding protein [Aeoliella sp. ICT_H6.2]|uniref:Zinc-binding protein n=1 Tax=Aeoliella straminimaris TaxID=2954799 RepID=A0A9X2F8P6_9BACT|nr:putative zinc-binding protein [Aeoliella straminimaris]MCO6044355.1 putative zinc-binding protein [Aeoliella straminimaris]